MGPSWAGPENIRSSNILSTSATSMVTRNLKTLGIPLARDFDLGSSIPYASQKFRMSFRVDRNTRCSNSSAARLSTAPRSAGTSSDWEPSAFETRAESIGMCRKRSFATGARGRLPARAAVCCIPCLILCFACVERTSIARRPVLTHRQRSPSWSRVLSNHPTAPVSLVGWCRPPKLVSACSRHRRGIPYASHPWRRGHFRCG